MSDPVSVDERRCDVVVIGGAAAGLAAALQLARSRRSVVVVDAGEPRNAPAAHMHGYLGHEGRAPGDFLAIARDEVRGYGVEVFDGQVREITGGVDEGFRATLTEGPPVVARRVLLATGVVDVLPDIPGVAEQWGRGVIHCPYCHGWEVRDRAVVVIGTGPAGAHQAGLFRQLSDRVTLVVHQGAPPEGEARDRLRARGVRVIEATVAEVLSDGEDRVTGVRLFDDTVLDAAAVVVGPRSLPRAECVSSLGITPVPGPMEMGDVVEVDGMGVTSVAGVYAAGNVADLGSQVLQAAAQGSRAGAVINADLVEADGAAAVVAAADGAGAWDERYGTHAQMWSGDVNGALVAEVEALAPGRALDVGCGEGGDALWLAAKGWQVTAVDVSQVALARARSAAAAAGIEVDWVRGDLVADLPSPGRYDLVTAQYPALRHTPDDDAVRGLLGAVSPGGTLLVVGHHITDPEIPKAHGFDPADFVQPADIRPYLDEGWEVAVDEVRPRVMPTSGHAHDSAHSDDAGHSDDHGSPHIHDVVLRVRRRR